MGRKIKVCLFVEGGVVHTVLANAGPIDIEIFLVDADTDGLDSSSITHLVEDERIVEAYVSKLDPIYAEDPFAGIPKSKLEEEINEPTT